MEILYTLQFSWMKIIVVQLFILSMGGALVHTGFNYSTFTLFFSIPAILFVLYWAIAHSVRTLKFYSDRIVDVYKRQRQSFRLILMAENLKIIENVGTLLVKAALQEDKLLRQFLIKPQTNIGA